MSLYSNWLDIAKAPRNHEEQQSFWADYFDKEKLNYIKILNRKDEPYTGKLMDLAKEFSMENEVFAGFIDGINTSLEAGEYDMETMTLDSDVSLKVDLEKLYYNMLDAKADWLYTLPEWDGIFTADEKENIQKRYRTDNIYVAQKTPNRNDACPCGSGKKYKKCCGK